jgi:hypothetical protein
MDLPHNPLNKKEPLEDRTFKITPENLLKAKKYELKLTLELQGMSDAMFKSKYGRSVFRRRNNLRNVISNFETKDEKNEIDE